jgi:hypothetical protein
MRRRRMRISVFGEGMELLALFHRHHYSVLQMCGMKLSAFGRRRGMTFSSLGEGA